MIDTIRKQRLLYNTNATDVDDDPNILGGDGAASEEDEDGSIESALDKETFLLLENDTFIASMRPEGTSQQQPILCVISLFVNIFVLLAIAAIMYNVLRQRRRSGRRNYRQVVQKNEHVQDSEL